MLTKISTSMFSSVFTNMFSDYKRVYKPVHFHVHYRVHYISRYDRVQYRVHLFAIGCQSSFAGIHTAKYFEGSMPCAIETTY